MKKIVLIGNVGREPIERVSAKGTAFHEFSLAVNDGTDSTLWVSVILSGNRSKVIPYIVKGKQLFIEGSFSIDVFKGNPSVTVFADELQLLGKSNNEDLSDVVDRKADVY
jgi:single-stranded DNA-binding protein